MEGSQRMEKIVAEGKGMPGLRAGRTEEVR